MASSIGAAQSGLTYESGALVWCSNGCSDGTCSGARIQKDWANGFWLTLTKSNSNQHSGSSNSQSSQAQRRSQRFSCWPSALRQASPKKNTIR
ncbi:MAG: hypothetical protein QM756_07980 [Polyangiaceae bacterium]